MRYIKSQAKPARQTLDMGVFNNGRQQWFVKSTELGDSAMALILSSRALEDPGNNVDDVKGGRGKFAGRDADCKEFITVHTSRVKDEAPPGDLKDNPPRGNLQVEPTILELKARIRELESTVQELKSAVHEIKEPQVEKLGLLLPSDGTCETTLPRVQPLVCRLLLTCLDMR